MFVFRCCRHINFSHFHLLQNHNQFQPNLAQKGNQVCSNEGSCLFTRGDNYEIVKIHWQNLKFFLKNHWANFNQTWHKTSLGDWTQVYSNEGPSLFWRGDNYEIAKNTLTKFKNVFLKNHLSNFNKTWHNAFFGEGESSLFKWRAPPFSRGDNYEIAKIHWRNFKEMFFSRSTWLI